MSHRILYRPDKVVLSSAVPPIAVLVDGEYVDIRLSTPSGQDLINERFYPHEGYVTLYEFAPLIEAAMRSDDIAFGQFILSAFTNVESYLTDSVSLSVLFCDRMSVCTDASLFVETNFLTSLLYRRVPSDSTSLFCFVSNSSEPMKCDINYLVSVDEVSLIQERISLNASIRLNFQAFSLQTISVDCNSIMQRVAADYGVDISNIRLLEFTVVSGQRSATCFIDESLHEADAYIFRNCFNVEEYAYFSELTTAKTDVNRSVAIINGTSRFFDNSVTKSYEVVTFPLTSDEAEWVDQLISSHSVYKFIPNPIDDSEPYILTPVLITDSTCEISDTDEKPNSIKFTWRYADERPLVNLPASPGIFSDQFDYRFS